MKELWAGGPLRGKEPPSPSAASPKTHGQGHNATVLVVDDDTSILDTVSAILSGEGYDVVSAASGQEALDAVTRKLPLLILLDMRMPIMDGWAVARALRGQGITVPIIVMTAAESAQRWADEVGAEGFLAKPFGLDELLTTVERFGGSGGRAN
ncbi:MAG TPA: response regulator [Candidatus Limnocylindria bacterium]|nr:response regulator [Candidatus Limnocylindria bacterium]